MGDRSTLPPGKYMAFGWWSNYQASVGSLHISSSDPEAPPHFQSGLLDQSADMPVLVFMYKWYVYLVSRLLSLTSRTREIARRIAVYRGEYAAGHPAFHPDSAAACKRHDGPITDDAKIVYTKEDNIIIEDWIRSNVVSAWHSMSTCPMADRAEGGVVDAKLDVYGVTGLKIAGTSTSLGLSRRWDRADGQTSRSFRNIWAPTWLRSRSRSGSDAPVLSRTS